VGLNGVATLGICVRYSTLGGLHADIVAQMFAFSSPPLLRGFMAFLRFAQYAFMRSAWAFRCAPLRRFRLGPETSGAVGTAAFFGGLPRCFVEPRRASIARFSLSRSAISRAMMCSVGIEFLRLARGGWPVHRGVTIFR